MKRVLYISYDGMTDPLGRSQVIPYLMGLSGKGHRVHVLSCEKPAVHAACSNEVNALFSEQGISWTALRFSTNPPGISKLLDIIRLKKNARRLHQKHNFHIVHCRSYIAATVGLELKQKFGIGFVFDMRGFWADERVEGNIWKLSNPFFQFTYKYFKKQEKLFFEHADAVVSLTQTGKSILSRNFSPGIENKTRVIPCCTDLQLFSPDILDAEQRSQWKKQLNIDDQAFVLSYLGSIGTWYMTKEMLDFFGRLQLKKPGAIFLFITGDDAEFIKQKAALAGIDPDSIRVVKAARNQVPTLLSLSHFSIFFIKPVFSKRASSPTKQGEIMSMGIPFITNRGIGDTDKIVAETAAGILVDEFSDLAYDRAISRMDSLLNVDRARIRQCAQKLFNLEDGVNAYHSIYQSIPG